MTLRPPWGPSDECMVRVITGFRLSPNHHDDGACRNSRKKHQNKLRKELIVSIGFCSSLWTRKETNGSDQFFPHQSCFESLNLCNCWKPNFRLLNGLRGFGAGKFLCAVAKCPWAEVSASSIRSGMAGMSGNPRPAALAPCNFHATTIDSINYLWLGKELRRKLSKKNDRLTTEICSVQKYDNPNCRK